MFFTEAQFALIYSSGSILAWPAMFSLLPYDFELLTHTIIDCK